MKMDTFNISLSVFVSCLLVLAGTAPLSKKENSDKKSVVQPTVETLSIEDALKALTEGTHSPVSVDGMSVSKSKTVIETNINGVKSGKSESETKIAKPSGKVVADIKTKVKTHQDGDRKPDVVSEVEVPDENVERKFGQSPATNPLEYSPRAVAEYLLATGNYAGVIAGFQKLVDEGQITSEAATLDIETVMNEYSGLVDELQAEEQVLDEPEYYDSPVSENQALADILLGERLREEEMARLSQDYDVPVVEDFVPEVIEEDYNRALEEAELRQQLSNLIDRIYEDLEAGNDNTSADSITESAEDQSAETGVEETPSSDQENSKIEPEKKSEDKKAAEKKEEKKSTEQKSA